ncbi:MAG: hypothetical protein HY832_01145, partial [Candidatus Aenigmarchaeota archaeon]|nr:hypothetical protein [Candidatus Aenigmarchaeota archaeon]
ILALSVNAGFCANPAVSSSSWYCSSSGVSQSDCCPSSSSAYGETGAPLTQSDCVSNYYSSTESSVGGKCTDIGCCYVDTESTCSDSSLEGDCLYTNSGTDWKTEGCSAISACTKGCCAYIASSYTLGTYTSAITSEGYCTGVNGVHGIFTSGVTSSSECSTLAATYTSADIECSDGIDNDGDGKTDYPTDPDCASSTDASESSTISACKDGIDNDGDGKTDYPDDPGCYNENTSSEELGQLSTCTGTGEISSDCNCFSTTKEYGAACSSGNYCVNGVCQSTSSEECSTGERQYCGVDSTTTCLMYQNCESGTWGDCTVTSACGLEPEVCTDAYDQDGDGLNNCDDLDCYKTKCGDSSDTSACGDKGYWDGHSAYICCSTNNVNDCDGSGDGIPDTCGSCACITNPIDPEIDSISYTLGAAQLTVDWSLACADVKFLLRRCTGADCPTDTTDYTDDEIKMAFAETVSSDFIEDAWEYTDTTVGANQRYCYVVEADYPDGTNTYSSPSCVDDSGDSWCQQMTTSQFCLDDYGGMTEDLTYRVGCTSENKISYIDSCRSSYGSDYICTGPYSDGTTSCEYQSDCATCGDPLGLYATLLYGYATYYSSSFSSSTSLCSAIPTCYFDYTTTTIDAYQECASVSSCYDYASESACTGQSHADTDESRTYNNKCLQRDCDWIDETSNGIANDGICKEKTSDYASCSACNDAVHNGIFDACTETRCQEFGVDSASCWLSGLTNLCTDISSFTCTAYTDATSCRGDYNVMVDIGGTNAITTASEDSLGLGLCYWNGEDCYKDANGDGAADADQEDMTPPTTTILSPDKMKALNITLLARDLNADGSEGTGVAAAYYCYTEDGSSCYPDTLVDLDSTGTGIITLGDGSGAYDFYYYSVDYAENLEVVQHETLNVDKQAPQIVISYYVSPDTSDPYDNSALTFEVILDEEAYCSDHFETGESSFTDEYNDHFVAKYSDLSDGKYLYSVNCTDSLGNSGSAFVMAEVDADTAIFDSSPSIYSDSGSVTLRVKTLQDADCGFSEAKEETSFAAMDEGFDKQKESGYYLHTRDWILDENGVYWFDVKCELADGTTHDDEIEFVYDDTAPSTNVVDSFGNGFDFSSFYNGNELSMYLACADEPEYGFGCNATYYCVDTTECTPKTLYDPTRPVPYDLSDISRLNLCYQSIENTYAGMGGSSEDVTCTELKVDSYDPELILTSPSDGEAVFVPEVSIVGSVDDPDATSGTAINTVTITVLNTNGTEKVSSDIDASSGFSYSVPVTLETNKTTYNYITVYGTDRSGIDTPAQTVRVRYTTELGTAAIWIVSPPNGVASNTSFPFTIGTYLEADKCGYSKNNAALNKSIALNSIASDTSGAYLSSAPYSIDSSKNGIPEYVYVKCLLVNGVEYAETLMLEYDTTKPVIQGVTILNSDGKNPPSIVEAPLDPELQVVTDDRTKCKYSFSSSDTFNTGMIKPDEYDNATYTTTNTFTLEGLDDLKSYILYIACQNGAYLTSETKTLSFAINTSAASGMYLISPEASGSRSFAITIGTTRSASSCTYGNSSESMTTSMTALSEKQFKTGTITVPADGNYTYYFDCWFVDGEKTDYFMFPVDTTAPVVDVVEDGNLSTSNTSLSATWTASDSLTAITYYLYSIGTKPGYNDTFNWANTTAQEVIVENLSLKNQSTYYWNVKAVNEVGLVSTVKSSDGVLVNAGGAGTSSRLNASTVGDTTYNPCSNSIKENDETDIDCGGSCDPCEAGKTCNTASDCSSSNCALGVCQESTCTDSIQNEGESDIDCGGNYCTGCAVGQSCIYHRDCASSYCNAKVCDTSSCTDGVKNGEETGTDCGGSLCKPCEQVSVITPCTSNSTCASKNCVNGACQKESCTDKIQNGKEEGIDCGGSCPNTCSKGLAWYWWTIILLLIIGVGGYYGYIQYMKKKGKLPPNFEAFGAFIKKMPSSILKMPQKMQMPTFQRQAMQQRMQQKQQARSKIFGAFEEKPLSEKLPERLAVKTPASKETMKEAKEAAKGKAEPTKEAPKKLGEIALKKPIKKGPSKTFAALGQLIKEKKK